MFRTAELGQKVSKEEYREREPVLREQLLSAQADLMKADFPVILVFSGVDGAGKGDTANLLQEWLDPRWIATHAYGPPSDEESERPPYWRYWRDLPRKGQIGIFLSAWYSRPLLDRVYGKINDTEFEERLEQILSFERMLANDGALILKFWMHLGKKAQKRRFKALESDPLQSWRVTKKDWKHYRMYEDFVAAAERILMKTSTGRAPWTIVEGEDQRFRSLKVGEGLLRALRRHLARSGRAAPGEEADDPVLGASVENGPGGPRITVLSKLDMTKRLEKKEYRHRLEELQGRMNLLHRKARSRRVSTLLVFEGWDAAGKGGAIRRITRALDARDYSVIPIAAPTDEELAHHYLWRFWRHLPRAGRVTFFDRSWYGRVLVERVEGFATEEEWKRAYAEINTFEKHLVDHGIVLVKFWLHITKEEQEARFRAREQIPYKRWKLTDEDWRNREKWDLYEAAVNDMVERTSTRIAPWILVPGNDKRYARVRVLAEVCDRLDAALANGKKGH